MDRGPSLTEFKKFCDETGRLKWAEYANIPVMLEFAKWWGEDRIRQVRLREQEEDRAIPKT
jgi:hypothetical protein